MNGPVRMAVLLLAGFAVVGAPAAARAAYPGAKGKVAFLRRQPGNGAADVWVMDQLGNHRQPLTSTHDVVSRPTWSPDGTRIAFGRTGDGLWLMDADGTHQTKIAPDDEQVSWSPDGTQIAFTRFDASGRDVWVMDANGQNAAPLTHDHDATNPAWAPDGTQIAFDRVGATPSTWVVGVDGNGEFKVFDGVGTPDWSPNSAKLVVSHGGSVTVIDSDGTHPKPITTAHSPGDDDFGARWSPDGGSLVFGRNYGDEDEDTGISVVNASGGQPTALTFVNSDNDGEDELPDWQPLNPRCADTDSDGNDDDDADGICDNWEDQGIDFDRNGSIDLKLYDVDGNGSISGAEAAQREHKDVYVEIDHMAAHRPDPGALADVVAAFANSPVTNPDHSTGVRLHLQVSDSVTEKPNVAFGDCTIPPGGADADLDTIKAASFGTPAERAAGANALGAKRFVFRYALFAHDQLGEGSTSGCAELPGNDFVVTLGSWKRIGGHGVGSRDQQAGTFMHELGHTLGLKHGGGDDDNCKPNYLSIMSYSRQTDSAPIAGRQLDYSRQKLQTLDKRDLSEPDGIRGPAGFFTAYGPGAWAQGFADLQIDWNRDKDTSDRGLALNLNRGPAGSGCDGDGVVLTGFDDWPNLIYDFRPFPDFADGAHTSTASVHEETHEQALVNSLDSDGDGIKDIDDVCAVTPDPGQQDADGDGVGDACSGAPPGPGSAPPPPAVPCTDRARPVAKLTRSGVRVRRAPAAHPRPLLRRALRREVGEGGARRDRDRAQGRPAPPLPARQRPAKHAAPMHQARVPQGQRHDALDPDEPPPRAPRPLPGDGARPSTPPATARGRSG